MDAAVPRAPSVDESPHPAVLVLPRDGDVIVACETRPAVIFTVRQVPGDVQFYAFSRDDAMRLARGFAQKTAVDLWSDDDGAFRLMEAHRPRGSSPPSPSRRSARL